MALFVYHYPGCSTCKKALAWLRSREIAFEAIHIVDQPPSRATLQRAAKLADAPVKKLFNVAGATMSEVQAFAALASDGKLIKRPLAISDDLALIGFDEAAWSSALR
jgi:arsenate reductase